MLIDAANLAQAAWYDHQIERIGAGFGPVPALNLLNTCLACQA